MKNKGKLKEITCKSALSISNLSGLDYALNPYKGCEHGCIYCYAPSVLREDRNWGEFVDIKRNIPSILAKELKTKKKGFIGISTVTDPYQPIEKKFEITRKCLEQISKYDFPISIQTKSTLVLRDLDIIKSLKKKEIGFTIITIDEKIKNILEPKTDSIEQRLSALREIKENNIPTWVFFGPILPYLTDEFVEIDLLIKNIAKSKVTHIYLDKLNLKTGLWNKLEKVLIKEYPDLIPKYKGIFFTKNDYFKNKANEILKTCKKYGITVELCF